MSTFETEAIILRAYRLSEADKIIVSLTKSEGTVRGVARGARRLKSRFGASLEPFTHSTLSFFAKEGRDLVTIKSAEIITSYFTLSRKPEVIAILEHFGQLIIDFSPPHQPDEKLFRLIVACLEAISAKPDCAADIHPYFELWVLKLTGFLPDLKACSGCGRAIGTGIESVNMTAEGALRCSSCDAGIIVALDPALHVQICAMNHLRPLEWAQSFRLLPPAHRQNLSGLATRLTLRALEKQPGSNKLHWENTPKAGPDWIVKP